MDKSYYNPWQGTIEFIHQKHGIVVKRCDLEELPNPLLPEYRVALFTVAHSLDGKRNPDLKDTRGITCAVYRLGKTYFGRPVYFFDRFE